MARYFATNPEPIPERVAFLRDKGYQVTDLASAVKAAADLLGADEETAAVWVTGRTDLVEVGA